MQKYTVLLLSSALALWGVGLLTIHSTMPSLLPVQLLYGVIGISIAAVISRINPILYTSPRWIWYSLSVISLLATELFGVLSRGSTRWLTIGGFKFQTSEFVKVAMCIFAAQTLVVKPIRSFTDVMMFGALMLVPTLLVFIEPDLGSSLIYGVMIITLVISSGFPLKKIGVMAGGFLLCMPLLLSFLQPYQLQRLETFLNPNHDPLGAGYNVRQASIAVGSGMFFGRGLGRGTQSHLKFLPERHTDFIFASFAEEFGFIGAVLLLSLYVTFGLTAYTIAKYARTSTESYLCIVIGTILLIQASINIGMNLGIVPVTGITLPFVSAGGSSLLSSWMMVGILWGCARRIKKSFYEIRVD